MWGEGATLHATNTNDQAVWIEADGASVYKFTLTAVTDNRRTTPWESRIAIYGGLECGTPAEEQRDPRQPCRQMPAIPAPAGEQLGSAGIFVYRATNFLVAENTVSRSLADAIHITSGSSHGKRAEQHGAAKPGDDMIAVVSYIGDPSTSAASIASNLAARSARDLNHHITIADNNVSGQYWGRGVSVVGGENVTIENNVIDKPTHGAAIYMARETAYLTFGVRNVVVRNNTITDVQTTTPRTPPASSARARPRPGHGAIEVYSWLFSDEAANSGLKDAMAVENIRIESNRITRTRNDGVRIGTGYGKTWSFSGKRKDGSAFTRSVTGGDVGLIGLSSNTLAAIGGKAIAINNTPNATSTSRVKPIRTTASPRRNARAAAALRPPYRSVPGKSASLTRRRRATL